MKIFIIIKTFPFFQMSCGISIVDKTLNKTFFRFGFFIGKNPGYFIIIPVLLALLCMTG